MVSVLISTLLLGSQKLPRIEVHPDRVLHTVSPSLFGVFFEEINHAGELGIYSEMLMNRGFEAGKAGQVPPGWNLRVRGNAAGYAEFDPANKLNSAKSGSLSVMAADVDKGAVEVVNRGLSGLSLRKGGKYRVLLWTRASRPLEVRLTDDKGTAIGAPVKVRPSAGWLRTEATVSPVRSSESAELALRPLQDGNFSLGFASLMPAQAWKNRANGTRADLSEKVVSLHPSFVRFPGGCYVEGNNLAQAFDWKRSIGSLEDRPGSAQRFWGYSSSDGLGFQEYLQWCEDVGGAPLYVANCGLSHTEMAPLSKMGRYVQDALDAIEYANGPVTSKWGAKRAKNGHPAPFNLKYVEIGNENGYQWAFGGLKAYEERYALLYKAIKRRYPNIQTIADVPVRGKMDIVDEHYYDSPGWFWKNSDRYDRYPRTGPKIYVGEYAATRDCGLGNLKAALGEAAFMTGIERNSDKVAMASYAPLFVNVAFKEWNPNLVVFNQGQSYGTPSFDVQRLFGQNRPTRIVALSMTKTVASPKPITGGIGLQTWKTNAEFKDLEVTVDGKKRYDSDDGSIRDWTVARGSWDQAGATIRQSELAEDRVAYLKSVDLAGAKRVAIRVKARAISGAEGFIVMFNARNGGKSMQWNVGGWGNTQHGFQVDGGEIVGSPVKGSIEPGKWYDVRIEENRNRIAGYLDGKLIQTIDVPSENTLAAVAGIDDIRHELVLKAVNGADEDQWVDLDFGGARLGTDAAVTELSGSSLEDENSFANPHHVSCQSRRVKIRSSRFNYRLPARSLSIMRIPLVKRAS